MMKYILTLVFFASVFVLSAQMSPTMQKDYDLLVELCNFDDRQQIKLKDIFVKKMSDLKEIEKYKSSKKYFDKRREVFVGAEGSIFLLVKKDQMEGYNEFNKVKRIERAERVKELKKQGASEDELRNARIGIE